MTKRFVRRVFDRRVFDRHSRAVRCFARSDRGSMPMALLVVIITAGVVAVLTPVVLLQARTTVVDTGRAGAIGAAQAGIAAGISELKHAAAAALDTAGAGAPDCHDAAADDADDAGDDAAADAAGCAVTARTEAVTAVLGDRACHAVSEEYGPSGSWHYRRTIRYYTADPDGRSADWLATRAVCAPDDTEVWVAVTATGWTVSDDHQRTLRAVYRYGDSENAIVVEPVAQ